MRFNKQELLTLAVQPSNRFDKEGILLVYERQDGLIFKRNENSGEVEKVRKSRRSSLRRLSCYGGVGKVALERWCRLRGNLLFYLKTSEAWSEPAGVIVLDIGNIQVDTVPLDAMWGFTIGLTSGGGDQRLAAISESERDAWIQVLKKTSYSNLKDQVSSLQQQLEKLNKGEIGKPAEVPLVAMNTEAREIPYMELSISCDNLRCDGNGWPPSTQAVLYHRTPPSCHWQQTGKSEHVPDCSNPQYLVTIPLWSSAGVQESTKLRVTINEIRDAVTGTRVVLGSAEFNVSALVHEATLKRRLALISPGGLNVGFVTVATQNATDLVNDVRGSSNPQSPTSQEDIMVMCHRRTQSLPPRLMMELRRPPQGWISVFFTNAVFRTYRFHSGLGGDIVVHESMLESRLNNLIPSQLLRMWINEEKDLVRELVALGDMVPSPWQQRLLQLLERHFRRIGDYTQALESVESSSTLFRPSPQKDKSTLQYCPVNLHLQRFWAQNSSLRKEGTFDCCTVGAFTAIPHGFKGGGLLKLLKNFNNSALEMVDNVRVAREAVQTTAKTVQHIQGLVKLLLALSPVPNHTPTVLKVVESLIKKTRSLMTILDPIIIDDALSFFEQNRHTQSTCSPTLADFSLLPLRSMAERLVHDSSNPSGPSSSSFFSSVDDPEPLELIRINLEASLMALAGKLQALMKLYRGSNNNGRLQQLGPGLNALLEKYEEGVYGNKAESTVDSGKSESSNTTETDEQTKSRLSSPTMKKKWTSELTPCLSKLLKAAQSLLKTLRLVHGVQRLKEELPRSATAHSLQHRRDVCFSQALTAAVTILVARLCCSPVETDFILLLSKAGVLFGVEGLLTPYRNEAGMWSDMVVAIEDLAAVKFVLVPVGAASSTNVDDTQSSGTQGIATPFRPEIHGCRDAVQVNIPVPAAVFSALPSETGKKGIIEFHLIPVFFNVGINEQALLAEKFGDMTAVHSTNNESFERLQSYHRRYHKLMNDFFPNRKCDSRLPLSSVLSKLQEELAATAAGKIQNVAVFHLAEVAIRKMKGLRMTCCKSAKDRTGMAVTLEQAHILSNEFDLAEGEFLRALSCTRSQGTRRANTLKNIGTNKFAFNRLQLMAFPSLYRPPPGSFGNVQS